MSQDWIKFRASLDTDPRVFTMADALLKSASAYVLATPARDLFGDVTQAVTRDVMRDVTLSGLLRVWASAQLHTDDGVFHRASLDYLDTLARVPGFGAAMALVGWAVYDSSACTVTLPNFLEHNAPNKNGARQKAAAAVRTARYRERLKNSAQEEKKGKSDASCDVTRDVTGDASPSLSLSLSKSTGSGTETAKISAPATSEGSASRASARQTAAGSPQGGDEHRPINTPARNSGSGSETSGQQPSTTVNAGAASLQPSSAGASRPADPLGDLKKRINTLRPAWGRAPHWSAEEESALFAARQNLLAMPEADWQLLTWFFRWANSSRNTGTANPVPVTTRRHVLVTELAAYLDRATTAWKQAGSPRLGSDAATPGRKPSAPSAPALPADPATAASFRDSLTAHGAKLPPLSKTPSEALAKDGPPPTPNQAAAAHLLSELGITATPPAAA